LHEFEKPVSDAQLELVYALKSKLFHAKNHAKREEKVTNLLIHSRIT
jgi:hypothetical protein